MKQLVILGAGESGVGAALLGKQKGFKVFVSDKQIILDHYKNVLIDNKIDFEESKHTEDLIYSADLVVKSPGIPDQAPIIKNLLQKGISVISEIEFAYSYTQATIIGITGSNGKTTTTMLTYQLLDQAGLNVAVGGNIGNSFAALVAQNKHDVYVLELSSFQLDGIINFKPHIAIITNITPDHLDRYDNNFDNYIQSKFKIISNQNENDFFIFDNDDQVLNSYVEKQEIKPTKLPFSFSKKLSQGSYIENNQILIHTNNTPMSLPTNTVALQGKHNLKNAMAASTVAKLLHIRKEVIRQSLMNFSGVEHRLEFVKKIDNITYINDSKATNVNATFFALESMQNPTIWIVGGVDKGNNYEELLSLVNEKVKAIICIGNENDKIISTFQNTIETIYETQKMNEAVYIASQLASNGDAVLLSPACASFDLFKNYEDRGNQFKEAIKNLK